MPPSVACMDDLFCRRYPALVNWCRKRLPCTLEDAEDIVHSTYLRCRRHWSVDRQSHTHEAAYFYRALRWEMIDSVRRAHRRNLTRLTPTFGQYGQSSIILHELVVREALRSLKNKQLAICLAFMAGNRNETVRCELHLSRSALAVYLCRAYARLCEALEIGKPRARS
jgi:DNA-directed RNA polymerase specialized sigma24 family protein